MPIRSLIALSSIALALPVMSVAQDYDGMGRNPTLSQTEQQALSIARQWQETGTTAKPFRGANGELTFVYGVHQPTIVCAILQVCVIMMQPGEMIDAKLLGDSARWDVTESMTGMGAERRTAIAIKPKDVGLRTSLVVSTSRRIYHMELVSTQKQYMALVAFSYPDEINAKEVAIRENLARQREEQTLPTGEYLGKLSFAYQMRAVGKPRVRPIRVFNDGRKTIIQMPRAIEQGDAPTLLVLDENDQKTLVNYRLQGDRYIVDSIFDKAELVTGVGKRQSRVVITRLDK